MVQVMSRLVSAVLRRTDCLVDKQGDSRCPARVPSRGIDWGLHRGTSPRARLIDYPLAASSSTHSVVRLCILSFIFLQPSLAATDSDGGKGAGTAATHVRKSCMRNFVVGVKWPCRRLPENLVLGPQLLFIHWLHPIKLVCNAMEKVPRKTRDLSHAIIYRWPTANSPNDSRATVITKSYTTDLTNFTEYYYQTHVYFFRTLYIVNMTIGWLDSSEYTGKYI